MYEACCTEARTILRPKEMAAWTKGPLNVRAGALTRAGGQLVESVLLLEVEAVSLGAVADDVAPGQQGKRLGVHHVVGEAREAACDEPHAPLALDVAVRGSP